MTERNEPNLSIRQALHRVLRLIRPIMKLPNLLSMFRLFLVPCFFLALYYYYVGMHSMLGWSRAFLLLIIVSDFLDGYIARLWGETSILGSLLDPLADKLFVTASFILLGVFDQIPAWLVIIVVTKDILVIIGWSCLVMLYQRVEVKPSMLGKLATGMQFAMVCIIVFFPHHFPLQWIGYLTAMLTILAFIHYFLLMHQHVSEFGESK